MILEIEQDTWVNRIRCFSNEKVFRSSIASKEYYSDVVLRCEILMKMRKHIRELFAFPLIKLSVTNVCNEIIRMWFNKSSSKCIEFENSWNNIATIFMLHYNFLFLCMVKRYIYILWNFSKEIYNERYHDKILNTPSNMKI